MDRQRQGANAAAYIAALMLGCPVGQARAHGQFPLPLGTLTAPQQDPVVVTTFGLLVPSLTAAPGYTWVCEEAVGGSAINTVLWRRTALGTVVAASREGAFWWSANLCAVTRATGILANQRVYSLATHPHQPWVAAGVGSGDLWLSQDDGHTYQQLTGLGVTNALPQSVLLYGEGALPQLVTVWRFLSDGHAEMQISVDGGITARWVVLPGAQAGNWDLLGLDGARPGYLYVRENGDTHDCLLRVALEDGSETVVREANDDLFMAATQDGQSVATGGLLGPLQVSAQAGTAFEERHTLTQVRGLAYDAQGELYAAANNWSDNFAVGRSDDQGLTWHGLGRFVDITGVHACASGANNVTAVCEPFWPALREGFGAGEDAGAGDAGGAQRMTPTPRPGCAHAGVPGCVPGCWLLALACLRRWR